MKTITIQIWNTDDKLTQARWSQFVESSSNVIRIFAFRTHFAACSVGSSPWQNACWVIQIDDGSASSLQKQMIKLREDFQQDSIAWTEGGNHVHMTPHGQHDQGFMLVMPDLSSPGPDGLSALTHDLPEGLLMLVTRITVPHETRFGWKNVAVGDVTRKEAIEIALRHMQNCRRVHVLQSLTLPEALSPPVVVKPEPFTRWAPIRGRASGDLAWEGANEKKPWDFAAEIFIPTLDCSNMIEEVVGLWRAQSVKPHMVLLDTGSTPEELAKIEGLRGPDCEVHSFKFNGHRHSSDFPAIAMDAAFSMCRTPVCIAAHSDVFLRRRDVLEEMLRACTAEAPAWGYQMTKRDYPGWEKVITHSLAAFHMPTMDDIGAGWSLRRAARMMDTEHHNRGRIGSLLDTELCLSLVLEKHGILPRLLGKESNFEQTLDNRMRHLRTATGAALYSPAHLVKVQGWLDEALDEARKFIAEWSEVPYNSEAPPS